MIDNDGMVATTLTTASAAVPRTSAVDFFEDDNHHLSQLTIVFPTHSILFFWRYQTNQDVQQLLTPRLTINEKASPPSDIASGVRILPQPSSSSRSPAHTAHQPPMEALQKLPIIRMMTRSSAPPVNNSTPQDSPPPNTTPLQSPAQPAVEPAIPVSERTPISSPRSLRQLSVFFLGSACLLASTALTRKAVWRRQLRTKPAFYAANTNPHEFFSPMSDALQAFNLATMNCFSVGVMLLGGTMWTLDIANMREARSILRRRLNYDSIYRTEDEVPNGLGETLIKAGEVRIVEEEEGEGSAGPQ